MGASPSRPSAGAGDAPLARHLAHLPTPGLV